MSLRDKIKVLRDKETLLKLKSAALEKVSKETQILKETVKRKCYVYAHTKGYPLAVLGLTMLTMGTTVKIIDALDPFAFENDHVQALNAAGYYEREDKKDVISNLDLDGKYVKLNGREVNIIDENGNQTIYDYAELSREDRDKVVELLTTQKNDKKEPPTVTDIFNLEESVKEEKAKESEEPKVVDLQEVEEKQKQAQINRESKNVNGVEAMTNKELENYAQEDIKVVVEDEIEKVEKAERDERDLTEEDIKGAVDIEDMER